MSHRMKNSIISFVIGIIIIYLAYKAYKNYQASGNIFKSSNIIYDPFGMPKVTDNFKIPTSFIGKSCFYGGAAPPPASRYYTENGKFYVTGGISDIINEGVPQEITSTAYIFAYMETRKPCGSNNVSGGPNLP